ncbi:hypothetical protein SOVF_202300, partial [Spinacia oleracea]
KALLTVSDDEFWEGVSPLEFGILPALQDVVTVVVYPIGGDTISATCGVVSCIEILSYVHGSTESLGFQSLKHEDAKNIGYVIPTSVITFIQYYEKNGAYTILSSSSFHLFSSDD